jgi:hypothetical protein
VYETLAVAGQKDLANYGTGPVSAAAGIPNCKGQVFLTVASRQVRLQLTVDFLGKSY